ncbi:MAG: hypothetical protein AAGA48_38155 [Myxococcota bacterium]
MSDDNYGYFVHNGPELQGTSELTSTMTPSELTFPVGEQPFMSVMGSEWVDFSALADFDDPMVELTWSCHVADPSEPHYAAPVGMTGHIGTFPASSGVAHRFVAWVMDDHSEVRFALEGRYSNFIPARLMTSDVGGHSFELYFPRFGAVVNGRLVDHESSYKLADLKFSTTESTEPMSLEDITLLALPVPE